MEYVDQSVTTVPKPGVRYYFTRNGGDKQSFLGEVCALAVSFFFSGIVPFLIILFLFAWYFPRSRRMFIASFLTLLIPVKTYDIKVLKWNVWNCLFDYFAYSMVFDKPFDASRKYLYAEYPHGAVPMACALAGCGLPHFSSQVPCYISCLHLALGSP